MIKGGRMTPKRMEETKSEGPEDKTEWNRDEKGGE